MNAKKCKAIRREIRNLAQRAVEAGKPLPANGIVYKDTRKLAGYAFPKGWIKERFVRLAIVGGPWMEEAKLQATKVFKRIGLNRPGSERAIYLATKREFA